MVTSDTPLVRTDETDAVVTVILNRPEKRNALSIEVMDGLCDVLTQLTDEAEKAILLTGAGPVTCAGADLDVLTGDEPGADRLRDRFSEAYQLLVGYPRPTVMACKGAVIGAGCQLSIVCDFAVLGEETVFSKPEVRHGVMSGYSTTLLAHLVGTQVAREITLTGDPIPPERALHLGLAIDVVAEAAVEATARELVEKLAALDPIAYETGKERLAFDRDPDKFDRY